MDQPFQDRVQASRLARPFTRSGIAMASSVDRVLELAEKIVVEGQALRFPMPEQIVRLRESCERFGGQGDVAAQEEGNVLEDQEEKLIRES